MCACVSRIFEGEGRERNDTVMLACVCACVLANNLNHYL